MLIAIGRSTPNQLQHFEFDCCGWAIGLPPCESTSALSIILCFIRLARLVKI